MSENFENENEIEEVQDDEFEDYVTFNVKSKDGEEIEMAIVDEFDFEKDHYVVCAQIKDEQIDMDGLYIYKAVIKGEDFTVEKIGNAKDYEKIANAYMEMN